MTIKELENFVVEHCGEEFLEQYRWEWENEWEGCMDARPSWEEHLAEYVEEFEYSLMEQ